jgi:hypothetical protein
MGKIFYPIYCSRQFSYIAVSHLSTQGGSQPKVIETIADDEDGTEEITVTKITAQHDSNNPRMFSLSGVIDSDVVNDKLQFPSIPEIRKPIPEIKTKEKKTTKIKPKDKRKRK